MTLISIRTDLKKLSNPQKAKDLQRFFKTGKGEYAEGDLFLGVVVPNIRRIAKANKDLDLKSVETLLHSKYHEERMAALFILVMQFQKGDDSIKKEIFELYLQNTKFINNWDLVDLTAGHIVGGYLFDKPKEMLYKLARSKDLWEKRISILSTFYFIMNKKPEETIKIAAILLNDRHDLIHKAVGWMLREVGKRCSQEVEEEFLKKHYKTMPRTMLRYAIEIFPEKLRRKYIEGLI